MTHPAQSQSEPGVDLARDRTGLATFSTQLALDRTTLAWIKTTLTMATFGFGMVGFFRTLEERSPTARAMRLHDGAIRMGVSLILLGIVATLLAGLSHWRSLQRLKSGQPPVVNAWPLSLTVAVLVCIIGLVGLWELFSH